MAFELLRTDYKDAVWAGLRKYLMLKNEDDTVSLKDVTQYTVYDDAFFGAEDANRINTAVNAIMASVEKGTDLYEAFTEFFENQKKLFTAEADKQNEDFGKYLNGLEKVADEDIAQMKSDYTAEIKAFENTQEAVYNAWFDYIKGQLSKDAAGNLQRQIDEDVFKSDRGNYELGEEENYTSLKSGCYKYVDSDNGEKLLIVFNREDGTANGIQFLVDKDGNRLSVRTMLDNDKYGEWEELPYKSIIEDTYTAKGDFVTLRDKIEKCSIIGMTKDVCNYEGTVYDVAVMASNKIMLAGADGIYLSTDSMKTWKKVLTATGLTMLRTEYTDAENNTIMAAGEGGVYVTADCGTTWEKKLSAKIVNIANGSAPTVIIDNANLYYADEQSDSWETISLPTVSEDGIDDLLCVQNAFSNGFIVGGKRKLYRVNRTMINPVSIIDCNVVGPFTDICHTSNGLYSCIDANVYYSKDYGTTWTKYNTPDIPFTGITAYCPDRNLTLLCAYNATQLCISVDNGATWQTFEGEGINKVLLTKKYVKVYSNAGYHDRYFEYVSGDLTAVVSNMYGKELELAPEQETIVIGSVTAAGQGTIPGTAKKITLFVKKVTATATTGTAVYQYVVMPTTEESITAPKISATTGAISNTYGTIAVSGENILLKSVKGYEITAVVDYKNY